MAHRINNRGQMVLWIIIAVFLVLAIFLFAYSGKKLKVGDQSIAHPGSAIESCTREAIDEITTKMMPQGGLSEPKNFKLYKNVKVEYLCENAGSFTPCIQQHPLFLEEMRKQIEQYVNEKVDTCFKTLKSEYEKRATTIELGAQTLSLTLGLGKISVNIARTMKLSKGDKTLTVETFPIEMNHPLYDLGSVAVEIANQEARYCHFDTLGYSVLSPSVTIRKATLSDETLIYQIRDEATKKELWVAIRSCPISATLGGGEETS